MISWSRTVCPIAAQVFLYMVYGLSDTLISLKGTTSFASEHKDLSTKIHLLLSVSVVESIAKLVPLSMVSTDLAGIIISLCDGIVTFYLTVILNKLGT
jgi:hypothetical protein